MAIKRDFSYLKRIVIKIGTTQITKDGAISPEKISRLAKTISTLKKNYEIVLISSGAVSAGIKKVNLQHKENLSIPYKQAAAAIGQNEIMKIYSHCFEPLGIDTGQVLLTKDVMQNRDRYRNACNTLKTLLKLKVLPIVNENDTMVVDEIKVGDNDRLAAMVAQLIDADLLILLSDIDGFFIHFGDNDKQQMLSKIETITPEIKIMANGEGSKFSTGGMITKIEAAQMCMDAGIHTIIANGKKPDILFDIINGNKIGTHFQAVAKSISSKKHWILKHLPTKGSIAVDQGAKTAIINSGKSLLPKGIISVSGDFSKGDGVYITDKGGNSFARGITLYGRENLVKIMGKKSSEIENILGYKDSNEVIHRNNLVLEKIKT